MVTFEDKDTWSLFCIKTPQVFTQLFRKEMEKEQRARHVFNLRGNSLNPRLRKMKVERRGVILFTLILGISLWAPQNPP